MLIKSRSYFKIEVSISKWRNDNMSFLEYAKRYYREHSSDEHFEQKYRTITMNKQQFKEKIENEGITQQDISDDIVSNLGQNFKANQVEKRFNQYFGKEKALSSFIMNELIFRLPIAFLSMMFVLLLTFIVYQSNNNDRQITLITMIVILSFISIQQTLSFIYYATSILRRPNIYGIIFGWKSDQVLTSNTQLLLIKRSQENALGQYAPAYYDFEYDGSLFKLKNYKNVEEYHTNMKGVNHYTLGTEEHCFVTLHKLVREHKHNQFKELNKEFSDVAYKALENDQIKV